MIKKYLRQQFIVSKVFVNCSLFRNENAKYKDTLKPIKVYFSKLILK